MKNDLSYTAEVVFLTLIISKLPVIFKHFIASSNNYHSFGFLEIVKTAFYLCDTFGLRYFGRTNIKNNV